MWPPPALRDSKKATLDILRPRVDNVRRRAETLAEVDADLARVEARLDLAMEEASLKEKPAQSRRNIELVAAACSDERLRRRLAPPSPRSTRST